MSGVRDVQGPVNAKGTNPLDDTIILHDVKNNVASISSSRAANGALEQGLISSLYTINSGQLAPTNGDAAVIFTGAFNAGFLGKLSRTLRITAWFYLNDQSQGIITATLAVGGITLVSIVGNPLENAGESSGKMECLLSVAAINGSLASIQAQGKLEILLPDGAGGSGGGIYIAVTQPPGAGGAPLPTIETNIQKPFSISISTEDDGDVLQGTLVTVEVVN